MLKTKFGALENYQMQFHAVEIGGKIMCKVAHEFGNISSPYGQAFKKVIPAALAKEKAFLITSQYKGEEKKPNWSRHPSLIFEYADWRGPGEKSNTNFFV